MAYDAVGELAGETADALAYLQVSEAFYLPAPSVLNLCPSNMIGASSYVARILPCSRDVHSLKNALFASLRPYSCEEEQASTYRGGAGGA